MRTKPVEQSIRETDEPEYQLKKRLSALDLTVFGVGVIIGAGIFTVTGRAALDYAGPSIIISFVVGAVCCGLAAVIKLWGLFFGPLIAAYLLAGWIKKRLSLGGLFVKGALFVLAMLAAAVISTPTLMAPYIARVALRSWLPRQGYLLTGYPVPDPTGDYGKGLVNWLRFFGAHYMKGYYFYFSFLALLAGSLWGSRKSLNRILLGLCAVIAIFLAYVVALKNLQYMLPLALPLSAAAFLFPSVAEPGPGSNRPVFLARPLTARMIQMVTICMVISQFVINLVILGLFIIRGQ
jgi:hypothetical protein